LAVLFIKFVRLFSSIFTSFTELVTWLVTFAKHVTCY